MANDKKSIELTIMGTPLPVKVDGNEDYIRGLADFVNQELQEIQNSNPHINRIQLMLIGCMNISEKYFQAQRDIAEMKDRLSQAKKEQSAINEHLANEKEQSNQLEQEKKEILKDLQACQRQLEEKNELLNQYREHLKQAKEESESNRKSILNLQNKLFESQIELSKSKDHQS
ncbi:cell division protein ZapA [Pseudoramibacter alactolyticus ATCC 23263]|jgi:cell division protein ZapA|uniref:Cell division protein ZapA n=2 Tax=Pseudoramibacter TaxID=113286 RepID=E6MEZ6_9FIRM|nr:cell division protein ZapA [Pseudoramibacter alactolyticus]EFV02346.1 cell division protein ZapA [Pseudoramibacter alactolyticus ATCC 23263]MBM6967626.1 cell division protein ZapA [Pseudoramibacter alactolyticus]